MLQNKYQNNIYDKVLSNDVKILLPEIEDERILLAIDKMKDIGFRFIELNMFNDNKNFYKEKIYKKSFIKNWSEEMVDGYLDNNFIKGLMLLEDQKADCLVAGATISTADVLRSSIRIIGTINKWVSSTFLMISSDFSKAYTYSDCGVIPEPNVDQLVEIAYNAARSHELLTLEKAKIAFLSFSTKGSAKHYKVERMQEALRIFSKKYPNYIADGEMQFDAAINLDVAKKKNCDNILKADANVFVFPDLNSGNIAYKITQYLAGYDAWGPLLNGLKLPVHDLSRGASIKDIINISAIAAYESLS